MSTTTKTKFIAPWNVKLGDKLVIIGPHGGEYFARVTAIRKGRGHFLSGNVWRFDVDNKMFPLMQFFGPHRCNGCKYPAEKVEVIVEK